MKYNCDQQADGDRSRRYRAFCPNLYFLPQLVFSLFR